MTWLLSYLTSTMGLIGVTGLAVVICLGLAWTLKSLKWAIAAAVVLAVGLAYAQIDHNAYQRAEAERAQATIAQLKARILAVSIITQRDTDRASADAAINNKLRELSSVTPPNASACLDAAAAGRVSRAGQLDTVKPTVPARRHSILLPLSGKHPR